MSRFLRVGKERTRDLDAIAVDKFAFGGRAAPKHDEPEVCGIKGVMLDHARLRDGIGDGCAGWQRDGNDVLRTRRCPDDGHVHGGGA